MIIELPNQEEVKEIKDNMLIVVSFNPETGELVTKTADYEG